MIIHRNNIVSSIQNIDTLVFDYGGVIVNIDDSKVAAAMTGLGVSRFKQFLHAKEIKRLIHQFIDGIVPTEDTLTEILGHCRKDATRDELLDILNELCGNLPVSRLEMLSQLRQKYKVYLLSNISDILWENSIQQIKSCGFQPQDCFDDFFLSYRMGVAKPDASIYRKMMAQAYINPAATLYFDDRKDNYEAGKALGFNAVLVKTNHIEATEAWQWLRSSI